MLTSKTAKEFAASASTCESSIEAKELFNTGMAELEKIFESSVSILHLQSLYTLVDNCNVSQVLQLSYIILCCASYISYTYITQIIHHSYILHQLVYRRKSKPWTI